MKTELNIYNDIYENAESGNVAGVLSALSGTNIEETEKRLSQGTLPKELAKELGVENEFCSIVMTRVSYQLIKSVNNNSISLKTALSVAAAFEEGFLNGKPKD